MSGRARLLEITVGVGSFRAMRSFSRTLAAHLRIASARRRRSRAEHLRDEMREHLRLKEAQVLSEVEQRLSKARILASTPREQRNVARLPHRLGLVDTQCTVP